MNDTGLDPIRTARDLVRQARGQARDSARRQPESTWLDAYTAIDRAEAQLGLADPSGDVRSTPGAAHRRPDLSCGELLAAADTVLAEATAGAAPSGLLLARAYLTEAIAEVSGRPS